MSIQKANRSTLVAQVAEQMEQMIENGQWKVGEKIPSEPELMAKFDISRNTLREAIQSLVHVGLIETRQGIGTTIKSNSGLELVLERRIQKSNLLESLEVRLGLEREAAQLAAERRTVDDLQRIQSCLNECRIASKNNDLFRFVKMDIAFHKSIVQATHNKMFIELYESITDALQNSINKIMEIENSTHFENEVHTELLHAIELKDSNLALNCVNQYLNDAKESLSLMLKY